MHGMPFLKEMIQTWPITIIYNPVFSLNTYKHFKMNNKSALLATLFATSGFSGDTKTPFLLNDGENSYEDLTLQKLHKLELLKKKQNTFLSRPEVDPCCHHPGAHPT